MWSSISGLLLATLTSAAPSDSRAQAGSPSRRVVLVELFTSQGCSSCPPADAFVRDLPALGLGRDKVLPLTFHVDYWDNLGWKDRWAQPAFTRRQAWYASLRDLRPLASSSVLEGLYTPQMIVDGRVHFSGQRRADGVREIERAAGRGPSFALAAHANLQSGRVATTIDVTDLRVPRNELDWQLWIALASPAVRTAVTRGENAGESLQEASVVRVLSQPAPLPRSPRGALTITLPKPDDLPWQDLQIVAVVQSGSTGDVGAAIEVEKDASLAR